MDIRVVFRLLLAASMGLIAIFFGFAVWVNWPFIVEQDQSHISLCGCELDDALRRSNLAKLIAFSLAAVLAAATSLALSKRHRLALLFLALWLLCAAIIPSLDDLFFMPPAHISTAGLVWAGACVILAALSGAFCRDKPQWITAGGS